ncbi:MAG: AHH domain-containing protein, partial [Myxococcales bacterium]|nr:AHH domain-containing protein [Myxococcales bacterium]
GKARDPEDWTLSDEFVAPSVLNRGYTGHEGELDAGLINMGGRLYDPRLGRMAGADPFVVDPTTTAGWNRFAYVFNDPLSLIDPSGYSGCEPNGGPEGSTGEDGYAEPYAEGKTPSGGKWTASQASNGSNDFKIEIEGETCSEDGSAPDQGPAPDARGGEGTDSPADGPEAGSGDSLAGDLLTGVGDGLGNIGIAVTAGGPLAVASTAFPPLGAAAAIGYFAVDGNPAGAARRFIGGLLDSETLSRSPDSLAYHGALVATEILAAAPAGALDLVSNGGRALLQRGCGSTGFVARIGDMLGLEACFVAGTLVMTPEGPRAIETIGVGDLLLTATLEQGDEPGAWATGVAAHRVIATHVRSVDAVLELRLRGDDGREQLLETTGEHPFFLPALGVFVEAEALRGGDVLESPGLGRVEVLGVRERAGRVDVYNLEVEEAHNYFVAGAESGWLVLVHNSCARAFREALIAAKGAPEAGWHAHHIVAKGAGKAQPARDILDDFGIKVSDTINGVFLPATETAAATSKAAYHPKIHTTKYYEAVNNRLAKADSPEDVIAILGKIARELRAGKFPY